MQPRDFLLLWFLASIWGSSFLFMRYAAPEFGAVALIQIRLVVGCLCLMPFVLWQHRGKLPLEKMPALAWVGLTNSALPFTLLAWATLSLSASFTSVLNSTAPFWTAVIAAIWFGDRLGPWQVLGLCIGAGGVIWLAESRTGLDWDGETKAVIACMLATLSYGIAANASKRHLQGVAPMLIAAFSLMFGALFQLPFTLMTLPDTLPPLKAWLAALVLGSVCTGFAYIYFYRLLSRVGPTFTVMVTYLVPVFGMLWGWLFLDESITVNMIVGCLIILAGTSLTLGLIRLPGFLNRKPGHKQV